MKTTDNDDVGDVGIEGSGSNIDRCRQWTDVHYDYG